MLLALLALDRRSLGSLAGACALASLTMLVHPFTGVLLCVAGHGRRLPPRGKRDRNALRAPIALASRLRRGARVAGVLPRSRLRRDRSARCRLHRALHLRRRSSCSGSARSDGPRPAPGILTRLLSRLDSEDAAFRLALVGAAGTAAVAVWELILVRHPPAESARLAIYWVDDRWRWPLLLVAGTVGLSGLARLARRGQIVAPVWFVGCFARRSRRRGRPAAAGLVSLPAPLPGSARRRRRDCRRRRAASNDDGRRRHVRARTDREGGNAACGRRRR